MIVAVHGNSIMIIQATEMPHYRGNCHRGVVALDCCGFVWSLSESPDASLGVGSRAKGSLGAFCSEILAFQSHLPWFFMAQTRT